MTRSKSKAVTFDQALEHVNNDGMVEGVTDENWGFKVQCYTVARQPRHPYDYSVTLGPGTDPYEWGAWIAYCKARRVMAVAVLIDKSFREQLIPDPAFALKGKWYFPAKLPSFFDADWQESKDKVAGENFVRWIEGNLDRLKEMLDQFVGEPTTEITETIAEEKNPWDD